MPEPWLQQALNVEIPRYLNDVFNGPLLKRLDALKGCFRIIWLFCDWIMSNNPGRQCGGCSVKLRCCKQSFNFVTQAWQGAPCGGGQPKPCEFKPLSRSEIRRHHEKAILTLTKILRTKPF